jgi:hypothetical protein
MRDAFASSEMIVTGLSRSTAIRSTGAQDLVP